MRPIEGEESLAQESLIVDNETQQSGLDYRVRLANRKAVHLHIID